MAQVHLGEMVPLLAAVPVFGYIVPPLAFVVLTVNSLMVITLLRRHMSSPINSLLIGIATMDTTTIMLPVPVFIYFYSSGHFYHLVPYNWCRAYFTMVYVLPLMCNMASIWITVALACVRCYSVWRPLAARSSLTSYRTNLGLVLIVFISMAVYFPSLFEYNFNPVETISHSRGNATSLGCKAEKTFSHQNGPFCEIHTWAQVMLTSLLPWFVMLFPDAGMLWRLRRAEAKRDTLLNQTESATDDNKNHKKETDEKKTITDQSRKLRSRRRMITWMIFIKVTIIWLVEIPFAVIFAQVLLRNKFDFMRHNIGTAAIVVLMLKYATYPMMFPLYCLMSQRFRQTFKDVVLCRSSRAGNLYVVKKSNSTQNTDRDSDVKRSFFTYVSSRDRRKSI